MKVFFFFSMCILMWHFRSHWKLLKNFPHLHVWEDYYVPPTSNHPQHFSQSTLLSGYALPFHWWKNRQKKMKCSARDKRLGTLPFQSPWDCIFYLTREQPAGTTLNWAQGSSSALSSARSRGAGWGASWLTAASLAPISDGRENNPKGPDFHFCVLSSDPSWLWDDWFYVQGRISCHHLICIPGDLSPLWHLIEFFL